MEDELAVVFLFFIICDRLNLKKISNRYSTRNKYLSVLFIRHCYFFLLLGDPVPLPTVLEEESLAEPTILSVHPTPEQLTYQIIDEGTIHRKKKLIDSRGFTYNVKERGKETTYWQCTVRPKGNYCRATVKERNAQFTTGKQSHNHPRTQLNSAPCDALPKPSYIARRANRLQKRHRPEDPVDLDFVLDETHLPDDFLQADVDARNRQHLVFAVAEQLELLSKVKTWYIDGTFKLVR